MRFQKRSLRFAAKRSGAIFVTALGVVAVLVGMVLVFASEMRTEGLATRNRMSSLEAAMIEQGAEQWVLAQLENATAGDAMTITQIPAQQIPVGTGYFWILNPDPTQDQTYAFGIADESAKLNINAATSAQVALLPGITPEASDSLVDWRDRDSNPLPNGAESDYYGGLMPLGYAAKNYNFETVEELALVKGWNPTMLFGYDLNRDGVLDDAERATGGLATSFNAAQGDSRGLFNYLTVYSTEPNIGSDGKARINVTVATSSSALNKYLTKQLPASEAKAVLAKWTSLVSPTGGTTNRTRRTTVAFQNVLDFLVKTGVNKSDYGKVVDGITTTTKKNRAGLVNINTAPSQVLITLAGLQQSDADNLVAQRAGADTSSIAWVLTALPQATAVQIGGSITSRSFQYSADIVAVSGDGRAHRRARIVVDATTLPAKIVYRKDLTALGWPLDPIIRNTLRAGNALPPVLGNNNNGSVKGLN